MHLRTRAHGGAQGKLVGGPATQRPDLDALEARYSMLRGTIRDHVAHQRRPFVRFFACARALPHAAGRHAA
jgi:molybdopterin synthase sulfur carrier subunit